MTVTPDEASQQCLQLILFGTRCRKDHDQEKAEKAFAAALVHAMLAHAKDLRALALYNLSLIFVRRGRKEESRKAREQAATFLSPTAEGVQLPEPFVPLFQELMADVLTEAGEHRKAIPYCEASIQHLATHDHPVAVADALWRAGKCYLRTGLRDHAAIPLRAAVNLFRGLAGDPRFPAMLLDLGNALRKSFPEEAERCYREAADFHVAQSQLESAAPAWVNLGVLCAEQGRYGEALAHYEKALRVREQSPGTAPERIGGLLNNIANVHRRMGQFEKAHRSLDRAMPYLERVSVPTLANAYGTRGLIFRDQGRDEEAVEWFRRSSAEHRKQPSPNLETLSEELDNEAAALERLGRVEEAKTARDGLNSVRARMAEVKAGDRGLGDLKPPAEGAVLVEIEFGIRDRPGQGNNGSVLIGRQLADVFESQEIGYFGGHVMILETTTFMYYGPDAEAMFRVLEPRLVEEPLCRGARVTIRQGPRHREVLLPRPVM
ncbi:MAG TPA: tetratricopeptide repeat protein [Bryobacteraceae bacterium]|nr:tetratricopeptide repeat protein [Bryobacteraceae bacterium]